MSLLIYLLDQVQNIRRNAVSETLFGTGVDGNFTAPLTTTPINGVKNYNNLTIPVGATITHSLGRALTILATGTVTIAGSIDVSGKGASAGLAGGAGGGGGSVGTGGYSIINNLTAATTSLGSSYPSWSYDINAGSALPPIFPGAGGGNGSTGIGGAGGGVIIIEAKVVNITGNVFAKGANGTATGGGGGGGGVIIIRTRSLSNTGTISVAGGIGSSGGNGGSGLSIITSLHP